MIRNAFVVLFLLGLIGSACAHTGGTTGVATITISGQAVRYSLTLTNIPAGPLAEQMRFGQPGVTPDYQPLVKAIREKIRLVANDVACVPAEGQLVAPVATAISVTGTVDFACADEVRQLDIRDDMADVLGPDHHTIALMVWQGGSQQFVFQPGMHETTVQIGQAAQGAASFFRLGIEHILSGYDHLLFLLVLMLRGGGFVQLLRIIATFTVAHAVAQALAALGVITLPAVLVEAVIALATVYLAAENFFLDRARSRGRAVSLLVGLVHGLGVSQTAIGPPQEDMAWSLLNFNLGLAFGQLAIVLLLLPILVRLQKRQWQPQLASTLSALVVAASLFLFVERAFFGA